MLLIPTYFLLQHSLYFKKNKQICIPSYSLQIRQSQIIQELFPLLPVGFSEKSPPKLKYTDTDISVFHFLQYLCDL